MVPNLGTKKIAFFVGRKVTETKYTYPGFLRKTVGILRFTKWVVIRMNGRDIMTTWPVDLRDNH